MASIVDATDSKHEGQVKMPRVLIVSATPFLIKGYHARVAEMRALGVEPVFCYFKTHDQATLLPKMQAMMQDTDGVHIDFTAESVEDIVSYVADPKNHIAMVCSGTKQAGESYGRDITKKLREQRSFTGPIAIFTDGTPEKELNARAKSWGAIGCFSTVPSESENTPGIWEKGGVLDILKQHYLAQQQDTLPSH